MKRIGIYAAAFVAAVSLTGCFGTDDVQPGLEQRFLEETAVIDEYIQDNNISDVSVDSYSLLRYTKLLDGSGLAPYSGTQEDPESVNLTYKTILLESGDTVEVAENVEVNWEDLIVGLRVGLRNVREAGRTILYVPSVLAYGEEGAGDIPSNAILIYDITLNSFEHPQLKNEVSYIQSYLNDNQITALKHPSGIFYEITDGGDGPFPTWRSGVLVDYEGRLIETGDVFDQGQGRSFNLSGLILGWQIGLQQVREGGSIRLFIPSTFAYGPEGAGTSIPGDASLEFDISLISIQN